MTSLPRTEASLYANKAGQQLVDTKSEAKPSLSKAASSPGAKDSFWDELQKASQSERPNNKSKSPSEPMAAARSPKKSPLNPKQVDAAPNLKAKAPSLEPEKAAERPTSQAPAKAKRSQEKLAEPTSRGKGSDPLPPTNQASPSTGEPATSLASPPTPPKTNAEGSNLGGSKGEVNEAQVIGNADLGVSPQTQPVLLDLSGKPVQAAGPMGIMSVQGLNELNLVLDSPPDAALQELQSLNFALGGRDQLLLSAPALALLSGHLEQVVPSEIPQLLGNNQLLQGILASADIQGLLAEPLSLNSALKTLGLGDSPLALGVIAKGLGSEVTTLGETLNALGFDVNRIQIEGSLLQQTIPLEGVQPYMLRSAKLRAQEPDEIDQSLAAIAGMLPQVPMAPRLEMGQAQVPSEPQAHLNVKAQSAEVSLKSPEAGELSALPNPEAPVQLTESFQTLSGVTEVPIQAKETSDQASSDSLAAKVPEEIQRAQGKPLTQLNLAQANLVQVDPFAAIGARLQTLDRQVLVIDGEDMRKEAKADEVGMEDIAQLLAPSFGPDTFGTELKNGMGAARQSAKSASSPLEALALSMLEGTVQEGERAGENMSERDSSSSQGGQGDGNSLFPMSSTPAQKESTAIFQIQGPDTNNQATKLSQSLSQNVFENATMMLKEGGGSIRVDLGSEGLGSLDLALDIKDKTVELRIIASSPHARELLAQDLPKLRDSLLNQNLNLEKVEIGLNQGSSWSQSSGDGRSFRGQSQNQEIFTGGSRDSRRGEVRSYRQITSTGDRRPGTLPSGSIQVRV